MFSHVKLFNMQKKNHLHSCTFAVIVGCTFEVKHEFTQDQALWQLVAGLSGGGGLRGA